MCKGSCFVLLFLGSYFGDDLYLGARLYLGGSLYPVVDLYLEMVLLLVIS